VAAQSLFPDTDVPSGHNFFDNAPLTLATTFYSKVDTVIDAARWYAAANKPVGGGSETYELVIWDSTAEDVPTGSGTIIGQVSVPWASVPTDQWTDWQPFSGLIRIKAYHIYKVGLRTSIGSYTGTSNYFSSADIFRGDFLLPQGSTLRTETKPVGTWFNGSFATDITSYPNQQFNFTSYFIDARSPDLGGVLTRVGQQQVVATGGTTTLSLDITPDAGDIVVVKTQTWDYTIPSGAITDASSRLSFTRMIDGNGSGFVPYVAIDTAVCASRPTSPITITSTPGSACRHSMEVEIWRNGTLGLAVVATRGSTDLSTSMSATAGSVISWVGSDSLSRDPANSVLVSGSSLVYTDDGHVGSNSVTYYGVHPVTSTGTPTFGIASNTAGTFSGKIAGVEIKQAAGTSHVTATLGAPWKVRGAVSQAVSTPWTLRGAVSASLSAPWAQRAAVSQSLSAPWNVRGVVTGTLVLPWALRGQITALLGTPWIVRKRVTSSLQTLWVVEGAPLTDTLRPSVGTATLTEHVTAYGPEQITAYL
jgi:hypothetical protein